MIKEFLRDYWKLMAIGGLVTLAAVRIMDIARGRCALGGEIMILPLFLILKYMITEMNEEGLFDCLYGDDDEEDEEYDF